MRRISGVILGICLGTFLFAGAFYRTDLDDSKETIHERTSSQQLLASSPETPVTDKEALSLPPPSPPKSPQKVEKEPERRKPEEYLSIEAVFLKHWDRLLENPDILGVVFDHEGLVIISDRPALMPTEVDGVPVKVKPPPPHLPPPPGVIVLHPDGQREHLPEADTCPPRFEEKRKYRWRFCYRAGQPQPIPSIMNSPIAGVPFEEALEIFRDHRAELWQLPGVNGLWLGPEGIVVYTTEPELVPSDAGGLPVIAEKREKNFISRGTSHTGSAVEDPLHGSVLIEDPGWDSSPFEGTLTLAGVVLSEGKPWGITTAHAVHDCLNSNIQCPDNLSPLNACPHYSGPLFNQPPANVFGTPGPAARPIGRSPRWTPFEVVGPPPPGEFHHVSDVAAIFLDNDGVEGNGSFKVDRKIENSSGTPSQIPFKGTVANPPAFGASLLVMSTINHSGGMHLFPAEARGVFEEDVDFDCDMQQALTITSLGFYTSVFGLPATGGSGSLILDGFNDIVAMQSWRREIYIPQLDQYLPNGFGGGVLQADIKETMKFDFWYGTETAKDNTFGIFSGGQWQLDNGDGQWTTSGATPDQSIFFGIASDRPVTGNWNPAAGNTLKIGVWRGDTHQWLLDRNGNAQWDGWGTDACYGPLGFPTDRPVPGDWDGDGKTEIGVWRPSTHQWFLDKNGNGQWDGCGIDTCVGPFGLSDDWPIAGDWTGTGGDKIGGFQPTSLFKPPGTWVLADVRTHSVGGE